MNKRTSFKQRAIAFILGLSFVVQIFPDSIVLAQNGESASIHLTEVSTDVPIGNHLNCQFSSGTRSQA